MEYLTHCDSEKINPFPVANENKTKLNNVAVVPVELAFHGTPEHPDGCPVQRIVLLPLFSV